MNGGERYVKLFSSITESTIWTEPAGTRLTWIAMLARSNMRGEVFASVPGLARLANVSLQECETALQTLLSPDSYSRTPDFEGRRIEPIVGGWRLLNFVRFDRARNDVDAAEREAERKRVWDREHRGNRPNSRRRAVATPVAPPTAPDAPPSKSDAPTTTTTTTTTTTATASKEQVTCGDSSPTASPTPATHPTVGASKAERLAQVTDDAIAAWNASPLVRANGGQLAAVSTKVGRERRQQQIKGCLRTARAICTEHYGESIVTPRFWTDYFAIAGADDFHAGRSPPGRDHPNWKPSFEFMVSEKTMLKLYDRSIAEGGES